MAGLESSQELEAKGDEKEQIDMKPLTTAWGSLLSEECSLPSPKLRTMGVDLATALDYKPD